MTTTQTILNTFKDFGHRITQTRRAIVDIFMKTTTPLSASEISSALEEKDIVVNKTTVYREIDFLLEQSVIQEIDLGDGQKRYESAFREHHHHLVCTNCSKIEDVVVDNELEAIEKKIRKNKNFTVTRHSLEFFGTCAQCTS